MPSLSTLQTNILYTTILIVKVRLTTLLRSRVKVFMSQVKPTLRVILIIRTCILLSGHGAHMPIRRAAAMINDFTPYREEAITTFLGRSKEMLCAPILPFGRVKRVIGTGTFRSGKDRNMPLHFGTIGPGVKMLTYILDVTFFFGVIEIATGRGRIHEVFRPFPERGVLVIVGTGVGPTLDSGDVPFGFGTVRTGGLAGA
jgi:hypothetical protein